MPEKKFTLFHLSLVPIQQLSIDMRYGDSREEWLRFALSESFEFEHRAGGTIHWVPQGEVDECIFGLVQRQKLHELHKPPEEGGEEFRTPEWQGAYVLIDPTHHDEGQRVAVENDVVGQPTALLKSLVAAINNRPERPYHTEIEPLFDSSRFWAFAKRHGSVLRSVNFNFVVPNMWGTESDLEQDLKETGKQTAAERVTVGFHSDNGVHTDSQKVRDGVEYAEKGAGTITAKSMDGVRFSSTEKLKTSKIPFVQAGREMAKDFYSSMKSRILGREQDVAVDDNDGNGDGSSVN